MELGVGGRCVGAESWFVRDSFIHVCLFTAMAVGLVTPEGSRLWGTSTRTRRRRQLIGSMVRLSSLPLEIDVCHLRVEVGLLFTCWVAACFVCRESGRRERDHGAVCQIWPKCWTDVRYLFFTLFICLFMRSSIINLIFTCRCCVFYSEIVPRWVCQLFAKPRCNHYQLLAGYIRW